MPNTIINKVKAKFDSMVDKTINHVSPKVQKEIKRVVASKSDDILTTAMSLIGIGITTTFILTTAKSLSMPVSTSTTGALNGAIGRGVCIIYNDITNNYYGGGKQDV